MRRLAPLSLLVLPLLAACPPKTGAENMPYCEDTPTEIALDADTPLGLTANDVIAELPAEEGANFVYADGTTTEATVRFEPGATARFVDSEAVYPSDGAAPAIAVICDDRIEIDGTLVFQTADGAFAEAFSTPLLRTSESLSIWHDLDLDGLAGTFDIEPFVVAEDYDELNAWISVGFADDASFGAVEGQASGQDECDDEGTCSAWAESVPVGSWGTASEE